MGIAIPVTDILVLVSWPDGCSEVPPYHLICETIELVKLYRENPDGFSKASQRRFKQWEKFNTLEKFERARDEAEEHQRWLNRERANFRETNMQFRINKPRLDN